MITLCEVPSVEKFVCVLKSCKGDVSLVFSDGTKLICETGIPAQTVRADMEHKPLKNIGVTLKNSTDLSVLMQYMLEVFR